MSLITEMLTQNPKMDVLVSNALQQQIAIKNFTRESSCFPDADICVQVSLEDPAKHQEKTGVPTIWYYSSECRKVVPKKARIPVVKRR